MSSTRRFFAARPTRPNGPRCHGGVSSLLRIAQRAGPALAGPSRPPGSGRDAGFSDSVVEHFLSIPAALGSGR